MSIRSVSVSRPHQPDEYLQGVFWDMDGTIVDTEPYWIAAEKELALSFGIDWTQEQAEAMVGQALEFGAGMLRKAGVDLPVRSIIDRLIGQVTEHVRNEVPWRPGARELLGQLRSEGIPCALVTMSETVLAREIVRQLPEGTFDFIITGDMVSNGKPHPEPYELAFETLAASHPDVRKTSVVAIEDSLPGATSAQAAGLVTLAVPNFLALPPGTVRFQWETLADRSPADLQQLLGDPVPEAAR